VADKKIDILEIILKEDLKILLDDDEKKQLDSLDQEFILELIDLVNNVDYVDEIERIATKIAKKSSLLPIDQQDYIKRKCLERVNSLKKQTILPDSSNVVLVNRK